MTAVAEKLEQGVSWKILLGNQHCADRPKLISSVTLFEKIGGEVNDTEIRDICKRVLSLIKLDTPLSPSPAPAPEPVGPPPPAPTPKPSKTKLDNYLHVKEIIKKIKKISGLNTFNIWFTDNNSMIICAGDPHTYDDAYEEQIKYRCLNSKHGYSTSNPRPFYNINDFIIYHDNYKIHDLKPPDPDNYSIEELLYELIRNPEGRGTIDIFSETVRKREFKGKTIGPGSGNWADAGMYNTPLMTTFKFLQQPLDTKHSKQISTKNNLRMHHIDHRFTFSYQEDLINIYTYFYPKTSLEPTPPKLKNKISEYLYSKIKTLNGVNRDIGRYIINILPLILLFINIYGIDTNQVEKLMNSINEYYYKRGTKIDKLSDNLTEIDTNCKKIYGIGLQYYIDHYQKGDKLSDFLLNLFKDIIKQLQSRTFVGIGAPSRRLKLFYDIINSIDIDFFKEYLLAVQSEISKNGVDTLFSKQLIKLRGDIQYRCLQFIYYQLLRPDIFSNIMLIDSYTLHRALFYAGYGREELYTGDNESILSGYNIVLIYGGEGDNNIFKCGWESIKSFGKQDQSFAGDILKLAPNYNLSKISQFSLFNDNNLNVNFNCQVKKNDLGISFNNMRGHASSPSYFFGHLFDNLSKKDDEIIFKRGDRRKTHCMKRNK